MFTEAIPRRNSGEDLLNWPVDNVAATVLRSCNKHCFVYSLLTPEIHYNEYGCTDS